MTGAPAPAVLVMGGFIVLLLLWLVHHLSRRRRFPLVFEAKVEHVCDGDSIIVRGRIGRVKLRIAGMDAPETAQPRGRESERRLRAMLQGRVVKVRSVAADRYGRWVSTVTADGVDAGLVMARPGPTARICGRSRRRPAGVISRPRRAQGARDAGSGRSAVPRRPGSGAGVTAPSCSAFSTSSGGSDAPSGASSGASENRRLLQTFSHAGCASPFCGGAGDLSQVVWPVILGQASLKVRRKRQRKCTRQQLPLQETLP